jgi:type IV protein arginine methyltransferase
LPALHVIIEPHPDVLRHMRAHGWHLKQGVKILEGKWQDFVCAEELVTLGGFDVIYTDTFAEDYTGTETCLIFCALLVALIREILALREFFRHLPTLLSGPESRFSFFNGLGATSSSNRFFFSRSS